MNAAPGSQPVLFLAGASHRNAPIELREKLALTAGKLPVFRQQLDALPGLREHVILNTCNRVEIYGVAENPATIDALTAAFCELQGYPPEAFERVRRLVSGAEAIRHLIDVASGLDSQMLGENEIFGQVKEAYAAAQQHQTAGPVLNRVFQKVFQAAKSVRSGTAITEGQISIANVAVDLALKIFGQLATTRVLLLGAGDIGEKTAKAFQSRGAATLTVSSRTLKRARPLAEALGAAVLPFPDLSGALSAFDIVVCATAAPDAVVTAPAVAAAMRRRRAQPLFFIDLALPRDVDPAVAALENVFVYNLDDLAVIAEKNLAAREAEVARARVIVAERTESLWRRIERDCPAALPSVNTPAVLPAVDP